MKSINSRPDLSVVRIYKQQEVVGAGFLASEEYILTCAHVVATALGIDADSEQIPSQEVELDFPTIQPIKPLTATVEFWLPVNPDNSPEDIAVLKLNKSLPKQAQTTSLSMTKSELLYGHEFEAFGFPEGRNGGAWAEGVIKRYVSGNWIQLIDNQNTGYRLEEGFSGTPIWDKNLRAVVGMAVAADKLRPEVKAAFMIPTELLFQAWNKLSEICAIDSRISLLIELLEPYFKDFKHQIEIAYQKSLPQLSVRNFPDSISEIVKSLNTRKDDSEDNYSCLEKFIGYLLLSFENSNLEVELCQSLTNWLERYSRNYEDLLELLRQEKETEQTLNQSIETGLLVAVFDDNNSLTVQGWLIEDVESYNPLEKTGCYALVNEEERLTTDKNLRNLAELIESLYGRSLVYCQCSIQKIHIFLPYGLIDHSIDSLVIEANNPFAPPIGTKYEVVIRFSERLKLGKEDQYSVIYQEKWKIVKNSWSQSVIDILYLSENTSPKQLYKQIMPGEVIGARLTEPIPEAKLESIMQAFYFAGIPIAVWLREEASNLDCCQELNNICVCCLEQLPKNIKDKRYQDWEEETIGIGNHLSLLWDDFDLVPKRSLIMS